GLRHARRCHRRGRGRHPHSPNRPPARSRPNREHVTTSPDMASVPNSALEWWKSAVFYQIYPRSFADSDGDGVGDLEGITRHLDYIQWLGIDAIWICPFCPSPMADFGYDVSDYCDVDPRLGTIGDFDRLVVEAHNRSIRVLIDWVPNHTSDQHPWFVESRSSRANPKRDWYIWRDGSGAPGRSGR